MEKTKLSFLADIFAYVENPTIPAKKLSKSSKNSAGW